jgi:hypothetical protein
MDIIDTIGAAEKISDDVEKLSAVVAVEKPELEIVVADLKSAVEKLTGDVAKVIAAWPSLTGENLK